MMKQQANDNKGLVTASEKGLIVSKSPEMISVQRVFRLVRNEQEQFSQCWWGTRFAVWND